MPVTLPKPPFKTFAETPTGRGAPLTASSPAVNGATNPGMSVPSSNGGTVDEPRHILPELNPPRCNPLWMSAATRDEKPDAVFLKMGETKLDKYRIKNWYRLPTSSQGFLVNRLRHSMLRIENRESSSFSNLAHICAVADADTVRGIYADWHNLDMGDYERGILLAAMAQNPAVSGQLFTSLFDRFYSELFAAYHSGKVSAMLVCQGIQGFLRNPSLTQTQFDELYRLVSSLDGDEKFSRCTYASLLLNQHSSSSSREIMTWILNSPVYGVAHDAVTLARAGAISLSPNSDLVRRILSDDDKKLAALCLLEIFERGPLDSLDANSIDEYRGWIRAAGAKKEFEWDLLAHLAALPQAPLEAIDSLLAEISAPGAVDVIQDSVTRDGIYGEALCVLSKRYGLPAEKIGELAVLAIRQNTIKKMPRYREIILNLWDQPNMSTGIHQLLQSEYEAIMRDPDCKRMILDSLKNPSLSEDEFGLRMRSVWHLGLDRDSSEFDLYIEHLADKNQDGSPRVHNEAIWQQYLASNGD